MKRSNDSYVGRKINEWTIVDYVLREKGVAWICRCKCGKEVEQKVWNIKSGKSKMCRECRIKKEREEKDGYKDNK